jgi:hypothetical protein
MNPPPGPLKSDTDQCKVLFKKHPNYHNLALCVCQLRRWKSVIVYRGVEVLTPLVLRIGDSTDPPGLHYCTCEHITNEKCFFTYTNHHLKLKRNIKRQHVLYFFLNSF